MEEIDYSLLFKLRLIVARFGEMDKARWWNTKGVLGRSGRLLLSRGFHKTHKFAQARIVFQVAAERSREIFPAVPGCITLWSLPPEIENRFDEFWSVWLDDASSWNDFFSCLEQPESDLLGTLCAYDLINEKQLSLVKGLRRSAEGRAVSLPGLLQMNNETITLLAAGFSRGESNKPAIPYARLIG